MELETIYIIENNKFGNLVSDWASHRNLEIQITKQDNAQLSNMVDGVIVFHEDHDFTKEDDETQSFLRKDNKMIHKVDINGTLTATRTNFTMWLDRNRPKSLLFLGDSSLVKNENLQRFLNEIED